MVKKSVRFASIGIVSVLIFLLSGMVGASVESDFFSLLNAERARLGLAPLQENEQLRTAARLHAEDMGANNYFSHTSLDGRTFAQRILAAGYGQYSYAGENIAYRYGAPDGAKVYEMWKNSPGHYANMISSRFVDAGLGIAYINGRTYYVLDLAKRYGSSSPPQNNTNSTGPVLPPGNPTNSTTPPSQNSTGNASDGLANFSLTTKIGGLYKTLTLKGSIVEKARVFVSYGAQARKICSGCKKFSVILRVPKSSDYPVKVDVQTLSGKNASYVLSQ